MHLDADEFLTPDRVPLEKAYQMVMSGEIKDGKTIAGILDVYKRQAFSSSAIRAFAGSSLALVLFLVAMNFS